MLKRLLDIVVSFSALIAFSPVLLVVLVLVFLYDRHSPIFAAQRVGRDGKPFVMFKIRSMVIAAEKLGGSSTSNSDNRITPVGSFVRKFKLDEVSQFVNVLIGDMSLVGPRPNTVSDVGLYTAEERLLLDVRPGITDFASIVFSDEGSILAQHSDPDLAYNQLIRPRKNRLAMFNIKISGVLLDLKVCILTFIAVFSRSAALKGIVRLLEINGAPDELLEYARRETELTPIPLLGSDEIYE